MRNFAHRGLWKVPAEQNTLAALKAALRQGLDVETDIRWWQGEFIIKHDDPVRDEKLLKLNEVVELLGHYKTQQAALHFKYDDWKDAESLAIVDILEPVKEKVFLFDMSLDYCRQVKEKDPGIKVGVSVGDKHYHDAFAVLDEALTAGIDIIWADEWRRLYTREMVEACHARGKLMHCISPDLGVAVGHPRAEVGYDKTWRNLLAWGADGICTDRSLELKALCRSWYQQRAGADAS